MDDALLNYPGTVEGALDPREHDFLIGHDEAQRLLNLAFSQDRFPQAWLLQGPEGVGKATFAWHFGRRLVELGAVDVQQISTEILSKYQRGTQSDIYDIALPPDDKGGYKTQIPVESIRHLHEKLALSEQDGRWRVVIIDPAEAMNNNAANALLKLLEEPPERVVFFLVSHGPHRLLPTIHSRCQHLRFQELSLPEMETIWQKVRGAPKPDSARLTLAEGSIRQALTMTDDMGALHQNMITMLSRPISRAQISQNASAIAQGNRQESLTRAKTLFQLLFGRLMRVAAQINEGNQTEMRAASEISRNLADWAQLSQKAQKSLDDAMRLNLDAEVTIVNLWLEIDQYLRDL